MPTFYMMVGIPGSGKSTWSSAYKDINNTTIISTDDIIESVGNMYGLTYNQMFDNITYSFAEKLSYKIANYAFERNDDLIWDQTNLTISTRSKKLKLVPSHYDKIAVIFDIPKDLKYRLSNRPGKFIPDDVIDSMIKKYEIPTLSEGFDKIIHG